MAARVKRVTDGNVTGAQVRVAARKPVCPHHQQAMKYDTEDLFWHCTYPGCVIVSRQNGDHVNATARKYTGPLSVIIDKRTGNVWLRLASSDYNGDAMMVLLANDYTDMYSTMSGVGSVLADANNTGQVAVAVEDVTTVDHSGRVRRR